MSEVKKVIFMSIISIFILIIGVSGVAYSYVNNQTNIVGEVSSVLIKDEELSVVFEGDTEIKANYLKDGSSVSKKFKVENIATGAVSYNIVWNYINNGYINKDGLVYTLKDNLGNILVEESVVPITGSNIPILKNITLEKSEEVTYIIEIKYRDSKDVKKSEQTMIAKIGVENNTLDNL